MLPGLDEAVGKRKLHHPLRPLEEPRIRHQRLINDHTVALLEIPAHEAIGQKILEWATAGRLSRVWRRHKTLPTGICAEVGQLLQELLIVGGQAGGLPPNPRVTQVRHYPRFPVAPGEMEAPVLGQAKRLAGLLRHDRITPGILVHDKVPTIVQQQKFIPADKVQCILVMEDKPMCGARAEEAKGRVLRQHPSQVEQEHP